MKPKYLSLFLVTFLCIAFAHSMSAQVYYYYDNNGNRITTTNMHHAPQKRQDSSKIKVYPNPTNGVLNVDITSFGTCGYATIYIVNGSGNIVSTQKTSTQLTTVNLSGYNPGMYYLRAITCDNEQYTCKIVKVNSNSTATPPQPIQRTPVKY